MQEKSGTVRCLSCANFSYFENRLGHNSPSALGLCKADPWDGNRGQWSMLFHPCKSFTPVNKEG